VKPPARILLIEDNPDIVEIVRFNLEREGYALSVAGDGAAGLEAARQQSPDLILLDLMLPRMDGLEVCRELKTRAATAAVPIIMLTARSAEADIVAGLDAGADDYVPKPFSPRELLARIQAVLRRSRALPRPAAKSLESEGLSLDPEKVRVQADGEEVSLTRAEFRILHALMAAEGRVLTRDRLLDRIGGEGASLLDRNIDVHVSSLRKKLGPYGPWIVTVRGIGYRFRD
jgi:DNA-binding response OmpR family regulator